MENYQEAYDMITRARRKSRPEGIGHDMATIIIFDIAQQIIRLESRLAGCEVR